MEVAPDAMVCVNAKGKIILVNKQTEILFGYKRDQVVGQNIEILIPKRYAKGHVAHRDAYVADPHVRPMGVGRELWALRADNSEFPVEISLSPITDDASIVAASIRDVSERLKAETKFRGLLDSTPDGMIIVDETGTITLVNAQAEQMFGHKREDMIGEKIEILIPNRYTPQHRGHREGFFAAPKNRSMGSGVELFAKRANGDEFPVEISLSPIETEDGRLVAAAVRDVTERKAAEAESQAAQEQAAKLAQLQELDQFRTRFINAAAHELNTPLTPIAATLKVLSITKDPAAQSSSMEILERSFKRLSQLVSDLLDAARFQSGNLKLTKANVDASKMLHETVSEFGAIASEQGVELITDIPDGLVVNCDRTRVMQVAYNLLSNALKFTAKGSVTVSAGADESFWFEVKDTGLGMDEEQLARLFEPFSRVHNTEIPGTGLGLYISQGFIETHGGRITATSDGPGTGATFRVSLPRD